jgi:hypothetical protein
VFLSRFDSNSIDLLKNNGIYLPTIGDVFSKCIDLLSV